MVTEGARMLCVGEWNLTFLTGEMWSLQGVCLDSYFAHTKHYYITGLSLMYIYTLHFLPATWKELVCVCVCVCVVPTIMSFWTPWWVWQQHSRSKLEVATLLYHWRVKIGCKVVFQPFAWFEHIYLSINIVYLGTIPIFTCKYIPFLGKLVSREKHTNAYVILLCVRGLFSW